MWNKITLPESWMKTCCFCLFLTRDSEPNIFLPCRRMNILLTVSPILLVKYKEKADNLISLSKNPNGLSVLFEFVHCKGQEWIN